jgi:hypothetical protein
LTPSTFHMPANTENLEAVPLASTSPIARSEGKGLDLEKQSYLPKYLQRGPA